MSTRIEFKKLFAQIRLNQEKKQVVEQERLKMQYLEKLIDKGTKRLFILWGLILLTIWTIYKILGVSL